MFAYEALKGANKSEAAAAAASHVDALSLRGAEHMARGRSRGEKNGPDLNEAASRVASRDAKRPPGSGCR